VSTRDFSWGKGGRCVWLTTYHPCSAETLRKSGALIYPEPLGPPRPVAGNLYFLSNDMCRCPLIPIQVTQINNKRAMVRHQSHTSLRTTNPLRPRGLPGKDSKSPQLNSFASQPPHGTTATLPDHQASKTTLDFRRATLRKRRWTLS